MGREFSDGTELSGGGWQKVALARGFVRDARVIFLDEPTASLDAKTEKALFEQFLALAVDKTAVIISHRLFIAQMVDRILVLEHRAYAFSVNLFLILETQGCRLRSNPGLKLPNAFGVISNKGRA